MNDYYDDPDYIDYIIEQQIQKAEEQHEVFIKKIIDLINQYDSVIDDNSVVFIEDNRSKQRMPSMTYKEDIGFIKLDEPDIEIDPLYSDECEQSMFLAKVELSKSKTDNYGQTTVFYYYDGCGDGGYAIAIAKDKYTPELMQQAKDASNRLYQFINKEACISYERSKSGKLGAQAKHGDSQDKAQKIIQAAQVLKDGGIEQSQLINLLIEDNSNQGLGYYQIRKILIRSGLFIPKKRTKK